MIHLTFWPLKKGEKLVIEVLKSYIWKLKNMLKSGIPRIWFLKFLELNIGPLRKSTLTLFLRMFIFNIGCTWARTGTPSQTALQTQGWTTKKEKYIFFFVFLFFFWGGGGSTREICVCSNRRIYYSAISIKYWIF